MSDDKKYHEAMNSGASNTNDELMEFLRQSEHAKVPNGKSKEEVWNLIEDRIEEDAPKKSIQPWVYIGIAASLALLVTFSFLFFNNAPTEQLTLSTQLGQSIEHQLPDGSTVIVNANSTISYSEEWNRAITLSGEAFFEVEKGENFIVSTEAGKVEVLGTSFNVFARDGELEVSCKTGKVQVTIPKQDFSEPIIPGEMISFRADTVKRGSLDIEVMGSWQAGIFYFENEQFSRVIDELKRQFEVEIELNVEREITFNGYFTNKNLEQALTMVCLPLGLQYEKTTASKVVITENE